MKTECCSGLFPLPRSLSNYYLEEIIFISVHVMMDFPDGSEGKASVCNAGDLGLTPGLGTSPGEGKGYPLQYSCLENSMARGVWRPTVHGISKESDTT